ncbi:MutS-related protein [Glaciimonas soli]|uniref:DNA mismatch repair protein MutS n=1 Tax=Glaciimonas soli TaxID=2590999 RepID=A0A843YXN7_9BURK|nr:hypothetical protein [Glaciimonas soli]MQR01962.1 hypothetical protein [Glaciimonas soli]
MNENKPVSGLTMPVSEIGRTSPFRFLMPAWKMLVALFSTKKSLTDIAYTNQEVAALFLAVSNNGEGCVDDQTWKDLDLEKYCASLTSGVSILGQQGIHLRLRKRSEDDNAIVALLDDAELRGNLKNAFDAMRGLEFDVSPLVFASPKVAIPWWVKFLLPFQILLLLAMLAPSLSLMMLIPLAGLILFTFVIQASWLTHIERHDEKLFALRTILHTGLTLAKLAPQRNYPILHSFLSQINDIQKIKRDLSRPIVETGSQITKLYADWFFLRNISHHFKATRIIRENQGLLRRWYLLIANLEADLAMANHISMQSHFCWATPHPGNSILLKDVINPLLVNASAVSFATDEMGVFLSGQNGAGKSTFLRTLGLNLLVGRAFGFCYADKATIAMRLVYTSIQIEDSMADGESLYVAELNRAKKLLESSRGEHSGIYIIDEIFRGTNHLESVSVAAALIHKLTQHALVIVSSHNLVLAPLLAKYLIPMQVISETGGVVIKPGLLEKPNGIALLDTIEMDESISNNARSVSIWLSSYLAHPKNCPDLLQ